MNLDPSSPYLHISLLIPAACYDSSNHCVWTCNDDWIDIWDCGNKLRIATHQLITRLGKSSIEDLVPPPPPSQSKDESMSVSEAISLMLRHIGIESCRLVPEYSTTVVHSLPLAFLEQCCELLDCSVKEEAWGNAQAVVITLEVGKELPSTVSTFSPLPPGCSSVIPGQPEVSSGQDSPP